MKVSKSQRNIFAIILFLFAATTHAAEGAEPKSELKAVKPFYVGIGPVISSYLGQEQGTKIDFVFANEFGLSEYFNWQLFYDMNMNTANLAFNTIASVGVGIMWFLEDRVTDNSVFFDADAGWGGGNKYVGAGFVYGMGMGYRMWRTKEYSIEISYRHELVLTNQTDTRFVANNPQLDQIRLGLNF